MSVDVFRHVDSKQTIDCMEDIFVELVVTSTVLVSTTVVQVLVIAQVLVVA